jgi:hypothetical protein
MIKLARLGWAALFFSLFTVCIMSAIIKTLQIHAESPQLIKARKYFKRMIHELAPHLRELKLERYYNRDVREKELAVEYRFMAELMPLHVLVLTQVLMGIKQFIPVELCNDKEAEPPSVYNEFMQSFFETKVSEATSSKIITKLFENRMDRLALGRLRTKRSMPCLRA